MKILLAVDGSDCSLAAVDEVARRPWPAGSSVKILSVIELPFLPTTETWAMPEDYYQQLEQAGKEQAQAAVENAEKRIRESQGAALEISSRITEGHTLTEILDEAAGWEADLIVLGSHGRRGLKRFLLGSVSNAVASHADCSVEIVRRR
jgi:nucleotide-binding universal stress UspA family protein